MKRTSKKGKKKVMRKPARKAAPKKKVAKKIVKKIVRTVKAVKKTAPKAQKPIGTVTHFYGGIKVAIVRFSKPTRRGAEVRFKGSTTDFAQKLDSMQYDHKTIAVAPKGKQIGVKVKKRVREGDQVYLG